MENNHLVKSTRLDYEIGRNIANSQTEEHSICKSEAVRSSYSLIKLLADIS